MVKRLKRLRPLLTVLTSQDFEVGRHPSTDFSSNLVRKYSWWGVGDGGGGDGENIPSQTSWRCGDVTQAEVVATSGLLPFPRTILIIIRNDIQYKWQNLLAANFWRNQVSDDVWLSRLWFSKYISQMATVSWIFTKPNKMLTQQKW